MIEAPELRTILSQKDEEFRKLDDEHHRHEQRLQELARKPYLTPEEELEEKRIKKEKLYLKDRMEAIARAWRESARAVSG